MDCYSGNRYVAFFDILGFKSWIEQKGSLEVFNYVKGYLDMMIKSSMPGATVNSDMSVNLEVQNVDYIYFSDTIVYYTKDDTYESFELLVKVASEFMNVFISGVSYMVRGAIERGRAGSDPDY